MYSTLVAIFEDAVLESTKLDHFTELKRVTPLLSLLVLETSDHKVRWIVVLLSFLVLVALENELFSVVINKDSSKAGVFGQVAQLTKVVLMGPLKLLIWVSSCLLC